MQARIDSSIYGDKCAIFTAWSIKVNMDRFYGDEQDNEKPYFEFEDNLDDVEGEMMEGEAIAYIQPDLVQIMQLQLAQNELKQHLVNKALEIAEQSFFWRFKTAMQKMDELELIYIRLKIMTQETEDLFEPTDEE